MPRRRKRKRSRRKTFSILNGLEALAYASILSEGVTGGNLGQFIGGAGDIKSTTSVSLGMGRPFTGESLTNTTVTGTDQISLTDIVQNPGIAIQQMGDNFQMNMLPMAFAAFTTSVGFSVGRKLLRKPLSNITRNIIHPVLGKGVRM